MFVKAFGQGGLEAKPFVVHKDKHVLDANPAALGRGVTIGSPLSEAKAILGGEGVCPEWDEESFRGLQAAWLDVCADYVDAVEPLRQHEAFVDLSDHPDPRDMARRLVEAVETRLGLSVTVGLASCRWVARVAAEWESDVDPIKEPRRYVAPMPVSLLPIDEKRKSLFALLGYRAIGEVSQLSVETLRQQFGEGALTIKHASLGGGDAYVNAAYPPDCAAGRFTYESAPDRIESFHNGLISLAKSLGTKLNERDAYGEILEVTLEHEDGTISQLSRCFSKPISSPGSLWPALRLLLSTMPSQPIVGVRARVPGLRKVKRVQLGLDGVASKTDREAGAEAAIAHVRSAFGDSTIMRASEVEEPRWKKVRTAWRAANGWAW